MTASPAESVVRLTRQRASVPGHPSSGILSLIGIPAILAMQAFVWRSRLRGGTGPRQTRQVTAEEMRCPQFLENGWGRGVWFW